jgi:hypothetical protein
MTKHGIMNTPITNRIVIGKLNKAGTEFLDGKEDLTTEAIGAVAEHIIGKYDGGVKLTFGNVAVTITVIKEIKGEYIDE